MGAINGILMGVYAVVFLKWYESFSLLFGSNDNPLTRQ